MCFGSKSISTPKVTSQAISSRVSTSLKSGDLVKITRTAKAHESGWSNTWVEDMNPAVGKIGKVVSVHGNEARLDVPEVGDHYYYPLFVLEQVKTLGGFKVGDKVRVKASRSVVWNKYEAKVTRFDDPYIRITSAFGSAGFYPYNLEHITETPVAEVKAAAQGISAAVKSHNKVFVTAQAIAITLAKSNGTVNADKVQDTLVNQGFTSADLGNAAGALFRGKNWKKVGTIKSTRQGNHAREISNWQYVGV